MDEPATAILGRMFGPDVGTPGLPILDLSPWLKLDAEPLAQVTAAFLVAAAGPAHPDRDQAMAVLAGPAAPAAGHAAHLVAGPAAAAAEPAAPAAGASADLAAGASADLASFYRAGLARMAAELSRVTAEEPRVAARLGAAAAALNAATSADEATDAIWGVFFPQAVGIQGHEEERIRDLRSVRTVTVTRPAPDPMTNPGRDVLFTSNVLLTLPAANTDIGDLPYPEPLRAAIAAAAAEPQRYWFDHPIQIGVNLAGNELAYGLRGLDSALEAEPEAGRVTCLLSVSVTHDGLGSVARPYLEAELARAGGLRHLDVVVVTEGDARQLVDEVIVPALELRLGELAAGAAAPGLHAVVGVDGEYGRHYSFLKAVAALWHVAIDPAVRATFKIDLDQVFPQGALMEETGRTAFGLLATPLWGATARDAEGREIELGMLAGALVNERDIRRGLFTPDVDLPNRPPTLDEHVFYSPLPQAISTRAEMMERYDGPALDGVGHALERIHVTGGTNGIRVDALRRHRPFTPTFVGRAEDQAYILSTLGRPGPRLAYAHAAGLIMRHDKEAFAGEALAAGHVGKLIGDDIRILVFSAYAVAAAGDGLDGALDRAAIGRLLDPFTGGFVSAIPQTVVLLRLALRTIRLFAAGDVEQAREYAVVGARRLDKALEVFGDAEEVARRVEAERTAWGHYYDALDTLEAGIAANDERALELRAQAVGIIDACRIRPGTAPGPTAPFPHQTLGVHEAPRGRVEPQRPT